MPANAGRTPAVTVTTVLYNSAASLERYAEMLVPGLESGLLHVVAVDNASPDHGAAVLKRLLPGVRIVANPTNVGFAAGCNSAWPLVATRYWLLLNPDVRGEPADIDRLVRWMDRRPAIGVASPLLRHPDGRALSVARAHDSLWRPVVEGLRLHKLLPRAARNRWLLAGHRGTSDSIGGWVPGAALIARAEAVRSTGLLDERLFMYGEDREWCWRMQRSGWEVGVCHEVELLHDAGMSARRTWKERDRVRREVLGHLRVTRLIHGRHWSRLFALLTGFALVVESADRRRDDATRAECRLRGRLYLSSLR